LAVIDEEPVRGTSIPKGVPKNRGGHGVPQKLVTDELQGAGFRSSPLATTGPTMMRSAKRTASSSANRDGKALTIFFRKFYLDHLT